MGHPWPEVIRDAALDQRLSRCDRFPGHRKPWRRSPVRGWRVDGFGGRDGRRSLRCAARTI